MKRLSIIIILSVAYISINAQTSNDEIEYVQAGIRFQILENVPF